MSDPRKKLALDGPRDRQAPPRAPWWSPLPRSAPRSAGYKLETAELRLVAALKHGEVRPRLVSCAERVRRAQLGYIKAMAVAWAIPTQMDDPAPARRDVNLGEAVAQWASMSVDAILARYQGRGAP